MRRFFTALFILSLVLLCSISIALADLSIPNNLIWESGSTATAKWDAVTDANYYKVKIFVYNNNLLIGESETGTTSCEIDVQQEINAITENKGLTTVDVKFSVSAIKNNNDGTSESGAESEISDSKSYTCLTRLSAPTEVQFGEDGIVTWNKVEGAGQYYIEVILKGRPNESYGYSYITGTLISNTKLSQNISELLKSSYEYMVFSTSLGIEYGDEVEFAVRMLAKPSDPNVNRSSNYSDLSNYIKYSYVGQKVRLSTPSEIQLSEDGIVTWNKVEGAGQYYIEVILKGRPNESYGYSYITGTLISNTKLSQDISELLKSSYEYMVFSTSLGIEYGDEVEFAVAMSAKPLDTTLNTSSHISESSNYIKYSYVGQKVRLPSPTGIQLSEDGILTWNKVEGAGNYHIEVYIKRKEIHGCLQSYVTGTMNSNNKLSQDISEFLKSNYDFVVFSTSLGIEYGDEVEFAVKMTSKPSDSSLNTTSHQSGLSNYIPFSIKVPVDSISLSPLNPILYVGNSYYLGKTIIPTNAFYTKIHWTSSDNSIVQVNEAGRITGICEGQATITASIGNVTASVPVTVYTIRSNITDEKDQKEVTDTAGSIIDELGNSNNPNLSGTDLNQGDIAEIKEEIHEGIERGDSFRSDILLSKRDWAHFKKYWDEIAKLVSNGNFIGGYDIKVEICHQDSQGNKYHIANITQFDNEIGFTIEGNSIPENAKGQLKDFTLIRIHDGQLEAIPVKSLENNQYTSQSDMFSEFVLLYQSREETWTVSFDANGGSGDMTTATVVKGQKYKLPDCTFVAPDNKIFNGWDKGNVGTEIEIASDTVIRAQWIDIIQKTEENDLTAVPPALSEVFNNVNDIKKAFLNNISMQKFGAPVNQIIFLDVNMLISSDGGKTWEKATEQDTQNNGTHVILSYPKGTNKTDFDFCVAHMSTVTSESIGIKAGEIEIPDVTKLDDGLAVILKGLSPVAIAWQKLTEKEKTVAASASPTATVPVATPTSVPTKVPKTSDEANPVIWLIMGIIGFAVIIFSSNLLRKSKH